MRWHSARPSTPGMGMLGTPVAYSAASAALRPSLFRSRPDRVVARGMTSPNPGERCSRRRSPFEGLELPDGSAPAGPGWPDRLPLGFLRRTVPDVPRGLRDRLPSPLGARDLLLAAEMAASAAPPVAPDAMVQEGQIHSPTGTFLSPMQPRWNTSTQCSHATAGCSPNTYTPQEQHMSTAMLPISFRFTMSASCFRVMPRRCVACAGVRKSPVRASRSCTLATTSSWVTRGASPWSSYSSESKASRAGNSERMREAARRAGRHMSAPVTPAWLREAGNCRYQGCASVHCVKGTPSARLHHPGRFAKRSAASGWWGGGGRTGRMKHVRGSMDSSASRTSAILWNAAAASGLRFVW
mmetsp:Transcript_12448/g.33957  ORF Transcript_12448/g.33957 Transcript_12448/m.33957 type:complete len:354 (+) Transcript_12448:262-1323(+)